MAPRLSSVRRRGFRGLAALAASLLLAPALRAEVPKSEETLPLGETRERSIAAGETHAWRVTVAPDRAVAVVVELRSLALDLEARRLGGGTPVGVRAVNDRWGAEVLVLETAGDYQLEIRPAENLAWRGHYTLRGEALPAKPEKSARRDALALMSRARQEAVPDTGAAQKQAEATYRQALAAWRSLSEPAWAADTLVCLGRLEEQRGELAEATRDLEAALALWRVLEEPAREAEALEWLGFTYLQAQGPTKEARQALESSLSLWKRLGESLDEAHTRYAFCSVENTEGALPEALDCLKETLAFFQGIHDRDQEAEVRNSLGGVYSLLGQPDEALSSHGQALALWHDKGDRLKEARALNNLAVVHRALGEWQEALRFYDQMREVQGPLHDDSLEGSRLNNVGYLYSSVGQPQRALGYLMDALKLRHKGGEASAEIVTLNNLGAAWLQLGDADKALEWHRKALALAASRKDAAQQANSHLGLAKVHLDRGDAAAALRDLEAGLELLKKKGSPRTRTESLHQRGRALLLAGRAGEALPALQEALAGRRAAQDRAGEADTLYELARAERNLGRGEEALSDAQKAVARVEELRIGVLNADLRTSFLATRHRAFSLLIDLLMDRNAADPGQGHDRQAFEVSERARARSLIDALRSGSPGRPAGGAPSGLLEQRDDLLRRLSAKIDRRRQQSGEPAEALQKEIDAGLADVDRVEAAILRQDPRFAAFSSPKPVAPEEIYGWLEPGTMLLEYSLGEDRSFLWALGAGQIHTFVLPGQKKIEDLVSRVYGEMSTAETGSVRGAKAAAELSGILLGPVWSGNAAARLRRLVVVPDGALGVLPFAALPVPEPGTGWKIAAVPKLLIEEVEVAYIPSATTLAVQRQRQRVERRAPATRWAAVLADPVFDADHLPSAKEKDSKPRPRGPGAEAAMTALEPLPATRNEAEAIQGLAPPGQVWLGLGLEANRETVLSGRLRDFGILHFATHAVADARNPELSGLFLSRVDAAGHPRDGFLGLSDIYDLDLDADLVVLSGCQTALGKEVRGEGLMGLTRGFEYAGVPRVVASLWRVLDRTTAKLMTRFYQAMWRDHLAPAAALREAQEALRREPRYRNPYSWAGFVLQGDWLGTGTRNDG